MVSEVFGVATKRHSITICWPTTQAAIPVLHRSTGQNGSITVITSYTTGGCKTAYGGGHHAEINIVNNYYKPGPASQHHRLLDVADDGTGRYYVAGNVMDGDNDVTQNNYNAITDRPGKIYIPTAQNTKKTSGISPDAVPSQGEETPTCIVSTPFPYEPIEEDTPVEAYRRVLESAGCSHSRDSYDKEVLRQSKEKVSVHSGTTVSSILPKT